MIIAGCASGADRYALLWAKRRHIIRRKFTARWDDIDAPGAVVKQGYYGPYNALAGFWRNDDMLSEGKPTIGLMAPGGKGTRDMRAKCIDACMHVALVYEHEGH